MLKKTGDLYPLYHPGVPESSFLSVLPHTALAKAVGSGLDFSPLT